MLKKLIIAFFIVIAVSHNANALHSLFNNNEMASAELMRLLEVTGVKVEGKPNLNNVHKAIEKARWQSPLGTDRWEMELPRELHHKANEIIKVCHDDLGMGKAVIPNAANYSGALFLGAVFKRVVERVIFYKNLLSLGLIDPKLKIWILTGERPLSAAAGESDEALKQIIPEEQKVKTLPTNETEMLKFVFHYLMPKDVELEYVLAWKDPNHKRATTYTSIEAFLRALPNSSTANHKFLVISNQPFIIYQQSVMELVLKKLGYPNISVHAVGGQIHTNITNKPQHAAVLLDTIAKTVRNLVELKALNLRSINPEAN
jgi:hypothetical protein